MISDIVKRRSFRVSDHGRKITADTHSRHVRVDARKGIAARVLCRLYCLTAEVVGSILQAGLSNQCPAGASLSKLGSGIRAAECGVGIDNESDQVN